MEPGQIRILVACEYSARVRDAFRAYGFDAWSCDLLPCDGDPTYHYQCDVREVLRLGWHALIGFPDCTFVCGSGLHWNKKRPERALKTEAAIRFFIELHDLPIDFVALENPVGCLSTRFRKPDQTFQPYEFGDDASKKTCLWLKGFPPLTKDPAQRFPGRMVEWPKDSGKMVERWSNQTDSGQNKLAPSETRAKDRSLTYQGAANAIAEQWGNFLLSKLNQQ